MNKNSILIFVFSLYLLVSGCTYDLARPSQVNQNDYYYVRPGTYFGGIGKVALFEPLDETHSQDLSTAFMRIQAKELRKLHTFSVMPVYKSDAYWYNFENTVNGEYDTDVLDAIRKAYGVNAVIFGVITQYESFPKLNIGLRLRMLDLRTGKILWGVENVWDTNDLSTQKQMCEYYKANLKKSFEPLGAEILEVSPREFGKFVATEIASTIPRGRHRW